MAILRNWGLIANGKFFKISRPRTLAQLNDFVAGQNFNFTFIDHEKGEFQIICDEDVLKHFQIGRENMCIVKAEPRVQEPLHFEDNINTLEIRVCNTIVNVAYCGSNLLFNTGDAILIHHNGKLAIPRSESADTLCELMKGQVNRGIRGFTYIFNISERQRVLEILRAESSNF
eukprot:GHVL01031923.1.p1 GENE.GHVL01031923.1~~GHVL01031923.1.p1  ORF type:complete len:173 (+),score=17.15 GHVL01031923.1:27-545(+)